MSFRIQILVAAVIGVFGIFLFYFLAEKNVFLQSPLWRMPKLLFVIALGWVIQSMVLVSYLVITDSTGDRLLARLKRYAAIYPSQRWWELVLECDKRSKV